MKRFVLHHRGGGQAASDLDALGRIAGVRVIDHELPGALLVEASDDSIAAVRHILKDWSVAEEIVYPKPSDPEREQP